MSGRGEERTVIFGEDEVVCGACDAVVPATEMYRHALYDCPASDDIDLEDAAA